MKHILRFDKEEMIKLINQIPDEMKLKPLKKLPPIQKWLKPYLTKE